MRKCQSHRFSSPGLTFFNTREDGDEGQENTQGSVDAQKDAVCCTVLQSIVEKQHHYAQDADDEEYYGAQACG